MWAASRSTVCTGRKDRGTSLPFQEVLTTENLQYLHLLGHNPASGLGTKSSTWKRRMLKLQIMSVLWDGDVDGCRAVPKCRVGSYGLCTYSTTHKIS